MKRILEKAFRRAITLISDGIFGNRNFRHRYEIVEIDKGTQILLSLEYKELMNKGLPLPRFDEVEFRNFSQNGEDGILLYIFSLVGVANKRVVEICAGDGIECNSANLIVYHGWDGLLFDGNRSAIQLGKAFYRRCQDTFRMPPKLIHAWITKDNINQLIEENDFSGEIDLLSIDMDGMDFWVWKEITCIDPRVVVLEYNNRWNAEQSYTVPYDETFSAVDAGVTGSGYFGASLAAFCKLGRDKGYRLVGCNKENTNAFFMRSDVGKGCFTEVTVSQCLSSPYAVHQHTTKYPLIRDKPIIEV